MEGEVHEFERDGLPGYSPPTPSPAGVFESVALPQALYRAVGERTAPSRQTENYFPSHTSQRPPCVIS